MVDLIATWILAPAVLGVVSCGLSLLLEAAAGRRLTWTLRPGMGMAVMIVLFGFGTMSAATAKLTVPAVVVLAIGGWVSWLIAWRDWDVAGVGALAGAVVFGVYALPFFVHGEATWAGYIKLDDSATFMAMADWALEHGRKAPEMALGSFAVVIQDNIGGGYPIGSFVGAAFMGELPGQDIAWTFQPGMAFFAGCLAMALNQVVGEVLRGSRWAPALAAVAGCLSALFLGYYLWGGVKEVAAAALIALGPAMLVSWYSGREGGEAFGHGLFLGVIAAALVGTLGLGGVAWLVPVYLLLGKALWLWQEGPVRAAAWTAGIAVLLGWPAVITPEGVFSPLQSGLTAETEMGNLAEPVHLLQAAGIWPALDFRQSPSAESLVAVLGLAVVAFALWGAWRGWRDEDGAGIPLTALVAGGMVATLATVIVGSPWVGAKALATYSPLLLCGGVAGVLRFGQEHRRPVVAVFAGGLVSLICAGVAWGAVDSYHGISFAPRGPFEELEEIGERFAGQGPALSTEVGVSGARHFLRTIDANSAGGRRAYPVLTREGEPHPHGVYLDISEIRPDQVRQFPLIVTRRSPFASRPSSEFELAWQGQYYEVWQRRDDEKMMLVQDLVMGGARDRGGVPGCEQIRGIAQMAGPQGELRAAPAGPVPVVVPVDQAEMPAGWQILEGDVFSPLEAGTMRGEIEVPEAGRYEVWVGGEIYGGLTVLVDGREVASVRAVVQNSGDYEPAGQVELEPGRHQVEIRYSGRDLFPGSGFTGTWAPFPVGPIAFVAHEQEDLITIPATRWRSLCGKRVDWIEARA